MPHDEQEDTTIYKVVLNHEEQYSIWPVDRENALGGETRGKAAQRPNAWPTSKTYGQICAHSVYANTWKKRPETSQ